MGFHGAGWFAYLKHDEKRDQPKVTRELVKRVAAFARPYGFQVLGLLLTILLISGITLISPLLYRDLIDNAIPNGDLTRLNWLALGMIGVPILNGVIGVLQRQLNSRIGEGVIYDLRRSLYAHLQRMSLRFFTQTRTGELMSRLNNDVIGAQRTISNTLVSIVSNLVSFVATLGIMLALEWRLTLLGLAILPLFIFPARRVGRVLRDLRRQSMEFNAEMNATMNETLNISGAILVKLFGREKRELDRFSSDGASVRDIGIRSAVVGHWFFMMLSVVSAVGSAVVFWIGGHLVLRGEFTIGTIVAFGAYLTQMYGPLMSLTNAQVEFAQSMVSFERVFEVLDIPIEIAEKKSARTLESVEGRIEFENLSFAYEGLGKDEKVGLDEIARFSWRGGGEALLKRGKQKSDESDSPVASTGSRFKWALQDLNFSIDPGQLVALVGPSGAGKTTTTYMIPRLYDPTEGSIRLDGHDIRDLTLNSLAENIGMVTQETYLFYETIGANLRYARPDATDEEVIAACKTANIHDFIEGLEDGYDTVVGERGYRLSGGERQRVAIARVVLKDPRILVLDEATSHLDSLSEELIQNALQEVMKGRSSLVIAHRLSTILAADKILVMKDGKLVEQGTHKALLKNSGLYKELYETQFKTA
ncbi:MAG: ABC transporter ATP-binding protein [Anaerolineae bacterium]|nr:ABC transporter ATP-binding protein [Anaerolineae bacterium]MBT7189055.1 ABC transporter ATP-binding protein [Anaerolineae bacterium]MBT7990328.1 ABC transporter ATP-binding protein [Anaerolineae bacterium]